MISSNFEKECESKIRSIIKHLAENGINVRREKLTRGPSFKVNSGTCSLSGKVTVFVDKRLSVEQQLQTLEEHKIATIN
jgi:hypothetical protein